ncbi:MAG TPA: tyrosine-type recombinase/integrase [Aliidongia sp.]|nr:tyrosine-type recombinase/integrase [Aliidongia sp.]
MSKTASNVSNLADHRKRLGALDAEAPETPAAGKRVVEADDDVIAQLPKDRTEYVVEGVSGLRVRRGPRSISFLAEIGVNGKRYRKTLKAKTIKKATNEIAALRHQLDDGIVPSNKEPAKQEQLTLEKLLVAWERSQAQKGLSPRYVHDDGTLLRSHGLARWGAGLPVRSLTRTMISEAAQACLAATTEKKRADRGTGRHANRLLRATRQMIQWGSVQYTELEDFKNPAVGIPLVAKENAREHTLTAPELCCVWLAANELPEPKRQFVKLLCVLPMRVGELMALEWDDLQLDPTPEKEEAAAGLDTWSDDFGDGPAAEGLDGGPVILIPASRMKGRRDHAIPLSPIAVKLFRSIPRRHERFVFPAELRPTREIVAMSAPQQTKSELGEAAEKIRLEANKLRRLESRPEKRAPWPLIRPWGWHDLRRTISNQLQRMGFAESDIAGCLAHASANTVTRKHYAQLKFPGFGGRRAALDAWSLQLIEVVRKTPPVNLPKEKFGDDSFSPGVDDDDGVPKLTDNQEPWARLTETDRDGDKPAA